MLGFIAASWTITLKLQLPYGSYFTLKRNKVYLKSYLNYTITSIFATLYFKNFVFNYFV